MKRLTLISLLATSALAVACSPDPKPSTISADHGAIHKDNTAIANQDANIKENRAEKARAKANGDVATQAAESVSIGVNKTVKGAKKVEKKTDERILEEDRDNMRY